MSCDDFYQFSGGQRTRGKKAPLPFITNICEVKFTKGKRTMCFKEDFEEGYTEVDFLKPRLNMDVMPPKQMECRGIPLVKKTNILKLMHVAPAAKRLFWMDISEREVADLAKIV